MTFLTFMGTGASASVLNDSRCLTTTAPMILPLATVKCGVLTKAPPHRVNGRGHGNGSEVPMHEQGIPTRHYARPRSKRLDR